MINSYTNSPQTIDTNSTINFEINKILTGCTIVHSEGAPSFKLTKPGFYFLNFNGDVEGTAAGDITVELQSNNVPVPGAEATTTVAATSVVNNIGFSTIIKILPSCCSIDNTQILTFLNSGIEAIFNNVNVVITKLC